MTTEASVQENLDQQLANNTERMQKLVEEQYNVEVTRSVALLFSCPSDDCARALLKALFAKGTRIITPQPHQDGDRYRIQVGVKHSLRDTVREDFTKDLVETAAGMHGSYDGWELLTDEVAEEAQSHPRATAA